MQKFNITTQGSYKTKAGEEKKTYPPVGKLTFFEASGDKDAGYKLELNMFPDTKFYVFPDNRDTKPVDDETGEVIPDTLPATSLNDFKGRDEVTDEELSQIPF